MGLFGYGTQSSSGYGTGTPVSAGGGVGTGILNSIFGAPQHISRGQYTLGSNSFGGPGPGPDASKNEIAKWLGIEKIGSTEKTRHYSDDSKDMIKKYRKQNRTGGESVDADFGSEWRGILDLIDPSNADTAQIMGLAGDSLSRQTGLYGESTDALSEFIRTGSPVDVSALVSSGITDLKEQFSGMGNLYGSDVRAEGLRLGSELGVDARERARSRQMAAIGMAPQVGSNYLQFLDSYEMGGTAAGRKLGLLGQLIGKQGTNVSSIGSDTEQYNEGSGTNVSVL